MSGAAINWLERSYVSLPDTFKHDGNVLIFTLPSRQMADNFNQSVAVRLITCSTGILDFVLIKIDTLPRTHSPITQSTSLLQENNLPTFFIFCLNPLLPFTDSSTSAFLIQFELIFSIKSPVDGSNEAFESSNSFL